MFSNFIQMSSFYIKSFCVHSRNVIPGEHNEDVCIWICPVFIPSSCNLYPVQMGQKQVPRQDRYDFETSKNGFYGSDIVIFDSSFVILAQKVIGLPNRRCEQRDRTKSRVENQCKAVHQACMTTFNSYHIFTLRL